MIPENTVCRNFHPARKQGIYPCPKKSDLLVLQKCLKNQKRSRVFLPCCLASPKSDNSGEWYTALSRSAGAMKGNRDYPLHHICVFNFNV